MPSQFAYNKKPSLFSAIKLKCPYCYSNSLLKKSSYFTFKKCCENCEYLIEREVGYWTGASWMINFPITGTLAFLLVVLLMIKTDLNEELIAGAISFFILGFGALIFPFCQSVYLYLDHMIKPLSSDDHKDYLRYKKIN